MKSILDYPAWSPDGKTIAFSAWNNENKDIYTIDVDGNNLTKLTDAENKTHNEYPSWSPNGNKITYRSNKGLEADIYIMNKDGSNKEKMIDKSFFDGGYVDYAPDGKKLVFTSHTEGSKELFLYIINTKEIIRLTDNEIYEGYPSWSPDSKRIAFIRYDNRYLRNNYSEVHIMDIENKKTKRITENRRMENYPKWSN